MAVWSSITPKTIGIVAVAALAASAAGVLPGVAITARPPAQAGPALSAMQLKKF
jgi:hypothetical protein